MDHGLVDSAMHEHRIINQEEFNNMNAQKALQMEDLAGNENSEYFQRRGNLEVMLSGNKEKEFDEDGSMLHDLSSRLVSNDTVPLGQRITNQATSANQEMQASPEQALLRASAGHPESETPQF